MSSTVKMALIGAAATLIFDTATALISRSTSLAYSWFSIGSFALYTLFGYLVARRSRWFFGAVSGALLGVVDSTLGWAISWNIGPGKPSMEMNPILMAGTIVFVMICAAVLGLIGGAVSLLNKSDA